MSRSNLSKFAAASALCGFALALAPPAWAEKKPETGETLTQAECQACHFFTGSEQAGTVGPPLVAMKARFPDRKHLADLIGDMRVAMKPHSMMPPFKKNGLLSSAQIEKIIDFLYTL